MGFSEALPGSNFTRARARARAGVTSWGREAHSSTTLVLFYLHHVLLF